MTFLEGRGVSYLFCPKEQKQLCNTTQINIHYASATVLLW